MGVLTCGFLTFLHIFTNQNDVNSISQPIQNRDSIIITCEVSESCLQVQLGGLCGILGQHRNLVVSGVCHRACIQQLLYGPDTRGKAPKTIGFWLIGCYETTLILL